VQNFKGAFLEIILY